MNRRRVLLSIFAMLCVGAFSSEDPARLLADTKAFFETHTVDLSTWPEVDRAYNEAALRKYLDDLDAVTSAKKLHELRSDQLSSIFIPPPLRYQVNRAYLSRRAEVVHNEEQYLRWSNHDYAHVGWELLFLTKTDNIDMARAAEKLSSLYKVNRDFVEMVRESFYDLRHIQLEEALHSYETNEKKWSIAQIRDLEVVSYDRQDIRFFLENYYVKKLQEYPENGELWHRLAFYIFYEYSSFSGRDLVLRLLDRAANTLEKDNHRYASIGADRQQVANQTAFIKKMKQEGYFDFSNEKSNTADAGSNAIDIAEISEPPVRKATSVVERAEEPAAVSSDPGEIKPAPSPSAFPRWGKIAGLLAVAVLVVWGMKKSRGKTG